MWATWDRHPLLTPEMEVLVYSCIQAECAKMGAELIAIGGLPDHVHLLARVPAALSVAELVKQVKGTSSHLANHSGATNSAFKWQGAYGAFTVSKGSVKKLSDYIARQKQHHADRTVYQEYEPGD